MALSHLLPPEHCKIHQSLRTSVSPLPQSHQALTRLCCLESNFVYYVLSHQPERRDSLDLGSILVSTSRGVGPLQIAWAFLKLFSLELCFRQCLGVCVEHLNADIIYQNMNANTEPTDTPNGQLQRRLSVAYEMSNEDVAHFSHGEEELTHKKAPKISEGDRMKEEAGQKAVVKGGKLTPESRKLHERKLFQKHNRFSMHPGKEGGGKVEEFKRKETIWNDKPISNIKSKVIQKDPYHGHNQRENRGKNHRYHTKYKFKTYHNQLKNVPQAPHLNNEYLMNQYHNSMVLPPTPLEFAPSSGIDEEMGQVIKTESCNHIPSLRQDVGASMAFLLDASDADQLLLIPSQSQPGEAILKQAEEQGIPSTGTDGGGQGMQQHQQQTSKREQMLEELRCQKELIKRLMEQIRDQDDIIETLKENVKRFA